ncbi:MAG: helix-turn-helix transcriptional regulator [Clostridiales bacterium]|jgi:transcriptional regulator with XRE-family HTH domain|nr:helix-turn-helix transcriptional regulator [Clostridiales bacterium]
MLYSQAEIIKHHRELKGMTQSQLAEGICSRHHILKAEAGTRKLSDFVLKDVLLKLGLNPIDFNVGIDTADNDTIFYLQMEDALKTADYSFDRAPSIKLRNDIINYLGGRKNALVDARYWELLKLRVEIRIHRPDFAGSNKHEIDASKVLKSREYAISALKLFRPDFDIAKIDTYYLARREYMLIQSLAYSYGYLGELSKEIEVLDKLKINFEKHQKTLYMDTTLNTFYATLLSAIGINYRLLGMWEQCLQHSINSKEIFLKSNDIVEYLQSLWNQSFSLMKLGRAGEGEESFKKYFMLLYAIGDGYAGYDIAERKKMYEDEFGGNIDIKVAW